MILLFNWMKFKNKLYENYFDLIDLRSINTIKKYYLTKKIYFISFHYNLQLYLM